MATKKMGMFKPQVHRPHLVGTVFLPNKPCIPSSSRPSFSVRPWPQPQKKYRNNIRVGYFPSNIKAVAVASGTKTSISVKATAGVTLKSPNLLGGSLLLELVSAELDPQTGSQKKPINANAHQVGPKGAILEAEFVIPGDFGEIGAVLVQSEHSNEIYLQHIILDGLPNGPIRFHCGSWIEPKADHSGKRIFFSNKEWPLKSTLDPDVYGPPESAITTELVEREIKAFMTIDVQALEQKKLFIIDYHDLFLPYVSKVRQIEGTTLYGSRALFFLTPDGTLKPLAIELTRPPIEGKPQWKQVFTPTSESTGRWLWRFAKVHFLAHDSGYHQLVSHWLRTHCVTEPYIIATNRQLSVMHPIYRLLHPHFRYTMHINALARESLINADGIIETSFSPGKYSVELSSVAYDQQWRFDKEALPADLINRGIAVEDPDAPHGLKLLIEDYPFANDGLVLWDALKQWVADYVNYYYKDANMVQSDPELQAWWTEIQTKGHEDKKDEPWWPNLQTPDDLIGIITTITWVASGHHSAVNFGQYAFAGYFPNRPSIARTNMPCEEPTEEGWQRFLDNPNSELLACFPSKLQATRIMATLDLLSEHSSDEEYLGKDRKLTWDEEPVIKEAFNRFSAKLEELERTIDDRNKDNSLKNRNGAGVVPYELLKGVPYSISI
ncbi:hypothetical protein AAG906_032647 [Vitis piasezkii]